MTCTVSLKVSERIERHICDHDGVLIVDVRDQEEKEHLHELIFKGSTRSFKGRRVKYWYIRRGFYRRTYDITYSKLETEFKTIPARFLLSGFYTTINKHYTI